MAAKKKKKAPKRKASKKQLANLAKGRAKLAKLYGVTKEFSRGALHSAHESVRKTCRKCRKNHSTSEHNAHAFYGQGSHLDKLVPAYKLTHKGARGGASIGKLLKEAMKNYR